MLVPEEGGSGMLRVVTGRLAVEKKLRRSAKDFSHGLGYES